MKYEKINIAALLVMITVPSILEVLMVSKSLFAMQYFSYLIESILIFTGVFLTLFAAIRDPGYQKAELSPENAIVTIHGFQYQLKMCKICSFLKNPRTHHCKLCNKCVDRYDFHSKLLSNCIGNNNKAMYFGIIVILSMQAFYILIACIPGFITMQEDTEYLLRFFLIVYASFSLWCFGSYTVIHIYLISTNLTLRELLKNKTKSNPFRLSWQENWGEFFQ